MKKPWFLLIAVLSMSAWVVAQVGGNSSTSAGAAVTPGQANANVNSSQNAQVGGTSTNSNVSGSAQASQSEARHEHEKKAGKGSESSGGATRGAGSAALNSSNALHAELTKPIDARKAKPGDEVSAKLTQDYKSDGKVVFHKGSKLLGHVTEAQAHSKDHAESRLGMTFDKIQPRGGEEASVQTFVQALAPPAQGVASSAADETLSAPAIGGGGGGRSGGGLVGGVAGGATSTVGGVAGGAGNLAGGVTSNVGHTVSGVAGTGLSAQGTLTNASRGAIGLQGLSLSSATDAAAQGSVITSATRTVSLESGTQMLLQLSSVPK